MGTTSIALKARRSLLLQLCKPNTRLLHTYCGRRPNSTFSNTNTTAPTPTSTCGGGGSSVSLPIFRIPSTATFISSIPRFTVQCALTENNFDNDDDDSVVTPPPLVGHFFPANVDIGHYKISLWTKGLEFESAKDLLDHYIQVLAKIVGSVEEAKKKIYVVSCEEYFFFFCAKIDRQTSDKLEALQEVRCIAPDYYRDARDNSAIEDTTFEFIPVNRNRRLFNIFDYQKSSECKMEGDSGHWLINIDQPIGGFAFTNEFVDYCSETLATFVGSKEEAKRRMYIIWSIYPFGFGAEIDEETSKKLKDLPNVLDVLPDYAFDIKKKECGALVIESSAVEDSAPILFYKSLVMSDFEKRMNEKRISALLESDVEDSSEDEDPFVLDSDVEDISEVKDPCQRYSDVEDSDLSVFIMAEVNKVLETARTGKLIGSSLDAKIYLHISDADLSKKLHKMCSSSNDADQLHRIFITSQTR